MPPSEAPIAIGRFAAASVNVARPPRHRRRIRERVVPVVTHSLSPWPRRSSVRRCAGAREMLGGAAPGVAGLPAAMEQQHGLSGIAIDVGDQPVAGGTCENRGCGLQVFHGRSSGTRSLRP